MVTMALKPFAPLAVNGDETVWVWPATGLVQPGPENTVKVMVPEAAGMFGGFTPSLTPVRIAASVTESPTVMVELESRVEARGTIVPQAAGLPVTTKVELEGGESIEARLVTVDPAEELTSRVTFHTTVKVPPRGIFPFAHLHPSETWVRFPVTPDEAVSRAFPYVSPPGAWSLTVTPVASADPMLLTLTSWPNVVPFTADPVAPVTLLQLTGLELPMLVIVRWGVAASPGWGMKKRRGSREQARSRVPLLTRLPQPRGFLMPRLSRSNQFHRIYA
jgi:hypothetical protein